MLGRAGLPGSLSPGYLLEVIGAANPVFSGGYLPCHGQSSAGTGGTAVLGSLRALQPLAGHLPGLPERTSSPSLAQELGGGLRRPLLLSSVLFPARNDPVSGVRGCAFVLERDC